MRDRREIVAEKESSLQMTSMIDVVFLLLAFFVITYKTPELEGDFNIRMSANAQSSAPAEIDDLSPVVVKLSSDDKGNLRGILFGDSPQKDFKELRQSVYRHIVRNDVSFQEAFNGEVPEFNDSLEIELNCDKQLRYEYAVQAITAVTGYLNADDQIVKMVDKVKFSPLEK